MDLSNQVQIQEEAYLYRAIEKGMKSSLLPENGE